MSAVHLQLSKTHEEQSTRYAKLVDEDDAYSYPVRGMLTLIMTGKIHFGHVYSLSNDFTSVACIQESREYSEQDFDVLTIYSKSADTFRHLLSLLAIERKWISRIVLIMYLQRDYIDIARQVLSKSDCDDLGSLIIFGRQSQSEYGDQLKKEAKQYLDQLSVSGIHLSTLNQQDVRTMVNIYGGPVPDKANMFKWMIATLPSSALRDSAGELLASCMTYSCGAGAVLYVKPEFRRAGYAQLVGLDLHYKLCELFPEQQYGAVAVDNTASLNMNMKLQCNKTETLVNWVIFTPQYSNSKI